MTAGALGGPGTVGARLNVSRPAVVALAVITLIAVPRPSAAAVGDRERATLARLCARFSPHDLNADGIPEIEALHPLDLWAAPATGRRGLVLVLLEERLARPLPGGPENTELRPALRTFVQDLAQEGWAADVVTARVYAGPVHQDGRTLLALRRFLVALRQQVPAFAGVVLLGDLPEAYLVRSYNWWKHEKLTLNAGKPTERKFEDGPVHYLRTRAEPVALRADLILADLDGKWESCYHQERVEIPYAVAVFPAGEQPHGGRTRDFETGTDAFEDFFWVNDGHYQFRVLGDGAAEMVPDSRENEECTPDDLRLPNPLARPDISVSRINVRHIALRPKLSVRGRDGQGLLSAAGLPQPVAFASERDVPHWLSVWEHDPVLERRLLLEYFSRNHRYRRGEFAASYRPASFAHGLGSGMEELRQAVPSWSGFNEPGYDVCGQQATVAEFIRWLKRPALLRALQAHSDPWGSAVERSKDVAEIEREAGGQPWSWVKVGDRLAPGLGNSTGKLDFPIFRTLWANRALPDGASMWIHAGCDSISPEAADHVPYSDTRYGYWQGAEGLLFYCQGLVLVGRAKVFYDTPRQFAATLRQGGTWGEAWRRYFETEGAEASLEAVGGGIGRKRSYFWGLLGDWTLTLRPVLDAPRR